MLYIGVVHKDSESDYGVSFPDFAGCVTAGASEEEAFQMAHEALQAHIDWMDRDGDKIPPPSSMETIKKNPEYADALMFLGIDVAVPSKTLRINLSVSEKDLQKIDGYAKRVGANRSAFLVKGALDLGERLNAGK